MHNKHREPSPAGYYNNAQQTPRAIARRILQQCTTNGRFWHSCASRRAEGKALRQDMGLHCLPQLGTFQSRLSAWTTCIGGLPGVAGSACEAAETTAAGVELELLAPAATATAAEVELELLAPMALETEAPVETLLLAAGFLLLAAGFLTGSSSRSHSALLRGSRAIPGRHSCLAPCRRPVHDAGGRSMRAAGWL